MFGKCSDKEEKRYSPTPGIQVEVEKEGRLSGFSSGTATYPVSKRRKTITCSSITTCLSMWSPDVEAPPNYGIQVLQTVKALENQKIIILN